MGLSSEQPSQHSRYRSPPPPMRPPQCCDSPDGAAEAPSYVAAYQYYASQGFVSPYGYPRHGEWSSGLCDCLTDVPTCVLGCLCPCAAFGRNAEVLDGGQTACVAAALLWLVLQHVCLCGCAYSCWYRRRLRSVFGLPESPCADCCVHLCCFPCAVCQESREIDFRSKFGPTQLTPPQQQVLARSCSF